MLKRSPRLLKRKQDLLLKSFIFKYTAKMASKEARVSRNTANLYFNHFREKIYRNFNVIPCFSGEIEIDHAFFGRTSKRTGYNTKHIKVLGILERDKVKKCHKVFIQTIEHADKKTLLPIIESVVKKGSIINTDCWPAFNDLNKMGYIHKRVNHTRDGFVGEGGAHTGTIDSLWGSFKGFLRRYRGLSRRTFDLHLKEFEFRYNHKGHEEMVKILKKII